MERSTIFKNAVYHLPLGYTVSIKVSFMHHLQRRGTCPKEMVIEMGKTWENIGKHRGK
jgi:hypothetical protein